MDRHKLWCVSCDHTFSHKTELFVHNVCTHGSIEEFRTDGTTKTTMLVVDIVRASSDAFDYRLKLEIDRVPKACRNMDVDIILDAQLCHIKVESIDVNESAIDVNESVSSEKPELNDQLAENIPHSVKDEGFNCATCGRRFNKKVSLAVHLSRSHGIRATTYQCYVCKKRCRTITAVSLHLKKKHAVQPATKPKLNKNHCNHCDMNFSSNAKLMEHWETLKNGKSSLCTVCFATFDRKYDLASHRELNIACRVSKSLCNHCGKYYINDTLLRYHIDSVHLNVRAFVCRFCSKAFTTNGVLSRHEAAHENKRQYVCNVKGCGQTFNNTGKLRDHTRFIHEAPKLNCTYCGKIFKRPVTLREHTRLHTGEKPYQCDICQNRFTLKGTFDNHIRVHHNDYRYKCDVCERRFIDLWHLKRHKKRNKCKSKSQPSRTSSST